MRQGESPWSVAGAGAAAARRLVASAAAPEADLLRSLSRPAELASLASRAAGGGTSAVEYEVTHLTGDGPGAVLERPRPPDETLHFAAAGLRVEVATWPATSPDVATSHELSESTVLGGRPVRLSGDVPGWSYRGSAVLNPGFLTDRSRSLEVLLSLGTAPWSPSHRDTLMLTRALRVLSGVATDTGLPILSLTSPAAPTSEAVGTTRGDGSGEKVRSPFAPCVRLAIGLDADRPASRLAFEMAATQFASENGLSLRLSDRRTGRIRGEWFAITPFVPAHYKARRDELFGWAADDVPAEAVPVTALGPARVGSTQTLCRWLERSNVGCLGASVTVLQDIAFINLLLPVAPARAGERPGAATATRAVDGLGRIASRCGLTTEQRTHREGHAQKTIDIRPVADYLLLAGSPVPCTFERRQKSGLPTRFPIWVAWDMPPHGVETADVLRSVTEALGAHAAVDVAFARSRRGERGRLQGRAKLSVVPSGPSSQRLRPGRAHRDARRDGRPGAGHGGAAARRPARHPGRGRPPAGGLARTVAGPPGRGHLTAAPLRALTSGQHACPQTDGRPAGGVRPARPTPRLLVRPPRPPPASPPRAAVSTASARSGSVSGSRTSNRVSPGTRLDPQVAAVALDDDALRDVEAEAGALADRLGGEERLEDPLARAPAARPARCRRSRPTTQSLVARRPHRQRARRRPSRRSRCRSGSSTPG